MRVLSVVGARPQFIKAALLSAELELRGFEEKLVHTGQHHDHAMSEIFFQTLRLPQPYRNLGVGSLSHAAQTGEMMLRLEPVMQDVRPDCVLVYGDTNSTLAGALVAAKLNLPIVHVEAGLRSFDLTMPEEVNRVVVDRLSRLLLAPTIGAATNLSCEGIMQGVEVVGDLMVDLALSEQANGLHSQVLARFALSERGYAIATIHRAANTDDVEVFARLVAGLRQTALTVVFPVHPRTRRLVALLRVGEADNIVVCEPLSYHDMLVLQAHARVVITDSGGMQKEAVTLGTPCVTLRETTEWIETLENNWNVLVGSDPEAIAREAWRARPTRSIRPFGSGDSARRIVDSMASSIHSTERRQPCAS